MIFIIALNYSRSNVDVSTKLYLRLTNSTKAFALFTFLAMSFKRQLMEREAVLFLVQKAIQNEIMKSYK